MAHVQYLDEMIREYLLFRGFGATVKAFDSELKSDKEKSFRVDKIIEQLMQFVTNYDLNGLRELWGHLESHMFSKLESHFTPGTKKLENAVLKMYLVNTVVNNKQDKLIEFFLKTTPELQNQSEWKDWFVLPYIKNPEENPTFSLHFTKQWQDTLLVSLHNFLASIIQINGKNVFVQSKLMIQTLEILYSQELIRDTSSMAKNYMPMPTLMHFEDDANKISKLEQRNESLKNRLALLIDRGPESNVTPCNVEPLPHLLDDFYIIAQENNIVDSQGKSFKSLIRNMGTGSSPILGRKDNNGHKKRLSSVSGRM